MGTFSTWDYLVFSLVLIISAGIGIYFRLTGGKQKTINEYLLADRSMSVLPVSFSLMASFMSAITILGVSTENYQFGTQFVVINIAYVLCTPICAYLFLPVFFKLHTASVYEYLEKRFGKVTRLVASLAYSVQMILYMGIVLYAPALALEAVTGIDKTTAILSIGIVCTFYSTIGGMKAVLITDVFQSLLMFAAIYSVIFCAAVLAGGFGPIWDAASKGGRLEFWNFNVDPTTRHTWWSLIIGGSVTYLSLYGVNQTQVQRLLTVRDLKAAQRSLWWNLPILCLLSFSTSFSGLAIYYFYKDCDPFLEKRISSRDQLMPLFVVDTMTHLPGLSGLFVSGIFSASLSTVSSAVSSLAAVTLEDYIKPLYKLIKKQPMPEVNSTLPSKITAMLYGIICIGLAFAAQSMGAILQASLTIFGVVGGPLLGLFVLGMCSTTANQEGALIGLLLGLGFSFWIGFGGPKPPPTFLNFTDMGCNNATYYRTNASNSTALQEVEYFWLFKISYLWYSVLGFLITVIAGLAVSGICKKLKLDDFPVDGNEENANYDLFIPPLARRLKRKAIEKMSISISMKNAQITRL